MAITFLEKRKRLKFLIPLLIIIILITLFVVWQVFFAPEESWVGEELPEMPIREIKIDFNVLEHPIFEDLQPFEKIPSFEQEIGRDNPFLPY